MSVTAAMPATGMRDAASRAEESPRSRRPESPFFDDGSRRAPSLPTSETNGFSPSPSFTSSATDHMDEEIHTTPSRAGSFSKSSGNIRANVVLPEGLPREQECMFGPSEVLDLSNYRMGPNVSNLLKALRKSVTLRQLDLSGINLDTDCSNDLAQVFRLTPLSQLRLEKAHVNSHSLKILYSHGMKESTSLTSLSLHGTIMSTSDQCKWIAKIVRDCTSLLSLNLSSCTLGNHGCVCVSHALCENRTLKTLDLSGNGIGAVGAEALRRALQAQSILILRSLQSLYVDHGPHGHGGGLDTLLLSGNKFSMEAFGSVVGDLQRLQLLAAPSAPHPPRGDHAPSSLKSRPPPRAHGSPLRGGAPLLQPAASSPPQRSKGKAGAGRLERQGSSVGWRGGSGGGGGGACSEPAALRRQQPSAAEVPGEGERSVVEAAARSRGRLEAALALKRRLLTVEWEQPRPLTCLF